MPKDGNVTRQKILDAAQALILARGFAGVSIDRLIDEVGITKGAFFYHFKNKNELAWALIRRFGDEDTSIMHEFTARARKLGRDPLQQMLVFVGLFEDMFEDMERIHPGCLFASYTNEMQQFDEQTREFIATAFIGWREHLQAWFADIAQQYPPRMPVDFASLADEFTVILEGAYLATRMLQDKKIVPQQLAHYRNYLELLFNPPPGRAHPSGSD